MPFVHLSDSKRYLNLDHVLYVKEKKGGMLSGNSLTVYLSNGQELTIEDYSEVDVIKKALSVGRFDS